jgi:WG containing repeat
MKKILPLLLLTVFTVTAKAQTDEAMLKWLNGHISAIDLSKSESNGEIQGLGIKDKRKIQELKFTRFGVETIGSSAYQKVNMVRLFFLKATIDHELVVLYDRGNNTISLHIADVSVREKYKEVFTRFAYTRINTNETDLPVYNSDKVDTKAVFPGGEEAWVRFVGKHFFLNPAIKYEVPPGRYEGTISFVVTKDSIVKDFTKAVNSPKGIQEAMLYVASKMPRWVPALVNGKIVSSTATIKMTIVVPVLTNSFEDQILKAEALKYQDLNFNTPNYANGNPGYLNLTPLNLEDNNTPASTKIRNDVNEESKNKVQSTGKTGKEIIPAEYAFHRRTGNEYIIVKQDGKYGMLDSKGNMLFPVMYEFINNFSEGRFAVKLNGKYGFVDKDNRQITPLKYSEVRDFNEGMAAFKIMEGSLELWGFINLEGVEQIAPGNYMMAANFYKGLARVVHNVYRKWGMIDKTGKVIIPFKYSTISWDGFTEELLTLSIDNKWGAINRFNKTVVPFTYDFVEDFAEGMAKVEINKKFGFVNKDGELVIPVKYDAALNFEDGIAPVEINGKWRKINKKGALQD